MEKYFKGRRLDKPDAKYIIEDIKLERSTNPYEPYYPYLFNIWSVAEDKVVFRCHDTEVFAWYFWQRDISIRDVSWLSNYTGCEEK